MVSGGEGVGIQARGRCSCWGEEVQLCEASGAGGEGLRVDGGVGEGQRVDE